MESLKEKGRVNMVRIAASPSSEYRSDLRTFCEMRETKRDESSEFQRERASVHRRNTRQKNPSKLEVKADSSVLQLCLRW